MGLSTGPGGKSPFQGLAYSTGSLEKAGDGAGVGAPAVRIVSGRRLEIWGGKCLDSRAERPN